MRKHCATHTYYPHNKPHRWWKTACKRKFLSTDKWSKPVFIADYLEEVNCPHCLENIGLELLYDLND